MSALAARAKLPQSTLLRSLALVVVTGAVLLILSTFILLFGNAFAAYATAYSLNQGQNIVPIVIGAYYTGNVLDNPHLAQALAFGMFVVLAVPHPDSSVTTVVVAPRTRLTGAQAGHDLVRDRPSHPCVLRR